MEEMLEGAETGEKENEKKIGLILEKVVIRMMTNYIDHYLKYKQKN